jgi:hypothetical protein
VTTFHFLSGFIPLKRTATTNEIDVKTRLLPAISKEEYEGVTKSFRTERLEQQLQMVQLSATTRSCIAIL